MVVDKQSMQKNFEKNSGLIVAEPLYLLLAFHGHPDAHEKVRELTLKAQQQNRALVEVAEAEEDLKGYFKKLSKEQLAVLRAPEKYTGKAAEKTEKICAQWKKELGI
jgi:adenylosuccinate lyase